MFIHQLYVGENAYDSWAKTISENRIQANCLQWRLHAAAPSEKIMNQHSKAKEKGYCWILIPKDG